MSIAEVVKQLNLIGRVSQIEPKYQAMVADMQLVMLEGWLPPKRGTSGSVVQHGRFKPIATAPGQRPLHATHPPHRQVAGGGG